MNFIKRKIMFLFVLCCSLNISSAMDKGINFNTQEQLNQFMGRRAVELFEKLNECSRYPDKEKGEHPNIPGGCWDMKNVDGTLLLYKTNKSIEASQALNKIFNNNNDVNILECFSARTLVTVKLIQEILGSRTFDTLYKKGEEKLHLSNKDLMAHNFYGLFCDAADKEFTIKNYDQPGALVAVKNLEFYTKINPNGCYANDNIITVLDANAQCIKYTGFGKEYLNGPLSYDEVREYMLKDYFAGVIKKHLNLSYLDVDSIKNYTHINDGERFIFDLIQGVPVTIISLQWINEAKTANSAKKVNDFLAPLR